MAKARRPPGSDGTARDEPAVTTTFFLVRHAAHDNVGGYLAGRLPGIRLGEAGRAKVADLSWEHVVQTLVGERR